MAVHVWSYPQTSVTRPPRPVYVTKIACSTDESGNCSTSSRFINGEILKVVFDRGTVAATTTAVITFESEQIDIYDVNSAAITHRYPRVETVGCPFVVSGLINIAVTGGQAGKSFDVYVFSR